MFGLFRFLRRLGRLLELALLLAAVALAILFYRAWNEQRQPHRDTVKATQADSDRTVGAELPSYEAYNPERMQAMWLSQFDLSPILLENGRQRERENASEKIGEVMASIAGDGFNTVFIQVRPNGDSLYPSALFPSSPYAVGEIGADFSYDPFRILLDSAHREGLSVHAWINPLRLFTEQNRQKLSSKDSLARLCGERSDKAVLVQGVWYLNPAYAETRALITEGVREILETYEVDGIHIDDYFYPTAEPSFDRAVYAANGHGQSLGDFRRDAVNALVAELYETVHKAEGNRIFGVSPSGNTERNYNTLYADVAKWCSEAGYLDYLCPQIYFGLEHGSHPFEKICREFDGMIETDGIRLCIGMTLGKAYLGAHGETDPYAGSGSDEWIRRHDILARCFAVTEQLSHCDGVAYFSYQYFYSPTNGSSVTETEEERRALIPLLLAKKEEG